MGETSEVPDQPQLQVTSYSEYRICSAEFQWLPCQVKFAGPEAVSITSYINNLHPVRYSSLYKVIEACIAQAIPLWNRTLSSVKEPGDQRIDMEITEYIFPPARVESSVEDDNDAGGTTSDGSEREDDSQRPTRVLVQPEPKEYKYIERPSSVDLRKQFQESGLQVITKLANIGEYYSMPFSLRTQTPVASIIQECSTLQLVLRVSVLQVRWTLTRNPV